MKREHLQKTFNRQELDYDVYWFVYFTWVYPDKTEKDFKTVIKAYSSENNNFCSSVTDPIVTCAP